MSANIDWALSQRGFSVGRAKRPAKLIVLRRERTHSYRSGFGGYACVCLCVSGAPAFVCTWMPFRCVYTHNQEKKKMPFCRFLLFLLHTHTAAAAVSLHRWLTLYAVTCDKPVGVERSGGGGRSGKKSAVCSYNCDDCLFGPYLNAAINHRRKVTSGVVRVAEVTGDSVCAWRSAPGRG